MDDHCHTGELVSFPCSYEFKVFGVADDPVFAESVLQAVNRVIPVGRYALRSRLSANGNYQCITIRLRLENSALLTEIYAMLRAVEGLRYLL